MSELDCYTLPERYEKLLQENASIKEENQRLREAARMIPVEERLPENPGWYMVRVSDPAGKVNHIEPKWYHGRGKWDVYTWTVTHWQQKPEPFEVK